MLPARNALIDQLNALATQAAQDLSTEHQEAVTAFSEAKAQVEACQTMLLEAIAIAAIGAAHRQVGTAKLLYERNVKDYMPPGSHAPHFGSPSMPDAQWFAIDRDTAAKALRGEGQPTPLAVLKRKMERMSREAEKLSPSPVRYRPLTKDEEALLQQRVKDAEAARQKSV